MPPGFGRGPPAPHCPPPPPAERPRGPGSNSAARDFPPATAPHPLPTLVCTSCCSPDGSIPSVSSCVLFLPVILRSVATKDLIQSRTTRSSPRRRPSPWHPSRPPSPPKRNRKHPLRLRHQRLPSLHRPNRRIRRRHLLRQPLLPRRADRPPPP